MIEMQVITSNGVVIYEKTSIKTGVELIETGNFESGWYLIQVKSDGKLIGKSNVLIQR